MEKPQVDQARVELASAKPDEVGAPPVSFTPPAPIDPDYGQVIFWLVRCYITSARIGVGRFLSARVSVSVQ